MVFFLIRLMYVMVICSSLLTVGADIASDEAIEQAALDAEVTAFNNKEAAQQQKTDNAEDDETEAPAAQPAVEAIKSKPETVPLSAAQIKQEEVPAAQPAVEATESEPEIVPLSAAQIKQEEVPAAQPAVEATQSEPETVPLSAAQIKQEEAPAAQPAVKATKSEPETKPLSAAQIKQPEAPAAQPAVKAIKSEPETKPLSIEQQKKDEPVIVGIDTINLKDPKGNWLFKRVWWEKAQNSYESIKGKVDAVVDLRTPFFSKRSDVDREVLDPFYFSTGMGQGELQLLLANLMEDLNKERVQERGLSVEERDMLEKLQADKKRLEQLQLDVTSITQLDNALDDVLVKVMEQINRVRGIERDAWNKFKAIAQELSDVKARELYYAIDSSLETIQEVQRYLSSDLTQHFNELMTKIKEQTKRVKDEVAALKEQGVHFVKVLEQKEQQHKELQKVQVNAVQEEQKDPGLMARIMQWIAGWWQSLTSLIGFGVTEDDELENAE